MKAEDKGRFQSALIAMCKTFNETPSQVMVDVYFGAVVDLDIDAVVAAMKAAETGRWNRRPVPAQIREIVSPGTIRRDGH